jgi:hypothetical protein
MVKLMQAERIQSPEMRRFLMLQPDEKEKLERGFAEGEASLFLEGLAPTPFGKSLKQRVLEGKITLEQAEDELCAHYIPAAVSRIA